MKLIYSIKRIARILFLYVPLGCVVLSLAWVMLYKAVPVRWTPLMLRRSIENIDSKDFRSNHIWVNIDDIAPVMERAVIAAEDGRFIVHNGFDFEEIRKMKEEHEIFRLPRLTTDNKSGRLHRLCAP